MTADVFGSVHQDSAIGSLEQASFAPRAGFLRMFDISYDAQVRTASMYGLEQALREEEAAQRRRLHQAGVDKLDLRGLDEYTDDTTRSVVAQISGGRRYFDAAKLLEEGGDGSGEAWERLVRAEEALTRLKAQRPDLEIKSYADMWRAVKDKAQAAERASAMTPTSIMGDIGGFIGGAVASLDPRTDPLNTLTLPIGGGGSSVVRRVVSQAGAQAVVEGINQITGVQENRRLLGLESGFWQGMRQVAASAIGGAVVQGAGEGVVAGVGAGVRKYRTGQWFPDLPEPKDVAPPAPPPPPAAPPRAIDDPPRAIDDPPALLDARPREPVDMTRMTWEEFHAEYGDKSPLGSSRLAAARDAADIDHATAWLERWDVKGAGDVPPPSGARFEPPRAATAIDRVGEINTLVYDRPYTRAIDALETVDDIARRVDPETFRVYDRLEGEKTRLREALDERAALAAEAEKTATHDVEALDARIRALEKRLANLSKKRREGSPLLGELEAAKVERAELARALEGRDTPEMAGLRAEIAKAEQEQRALAPVVSRAYDIAKGQWATGGPSIDALNFLKRLETGQFQFRGRRDVPPPPRAEPTIEEKIPALAARPDVVAKMPPGADAADKVAAVVKAVDAEAGDYVERAMKAALDTDALKPFEPPRAKSAKPSYTFPVRRNDGATLTLDAKEGGALLSIDSYPHMRDAQGRINGEDLADNLAFDVFTALREGRSVTLHRQSFAGGRLWERPVEIVAVKDGMMQDAKGQRWGTMDFAAGGSVVEIGTPTRVVLPDGQAVSLTDRIPVTGEDGVVRSVTVRDFLREIQEDGELLKAAERCGT